MKIYGYEGALSRREEFETVSRGGALPGQTSGAVELAVKNTRQFRVTKLATVSGIHYSVSREHKPLAADY